MSWLSTSIGVSLFFHPSCQRRRVLSFSSLLLRAGLLQPDPEQLAAEHGTSLSMSRTALALRWLSLVALAQGATASPQSPSPPPPSPGSYWLEGVKCPLGHLKTLFELSGALQLPYQLSRDSDAKDVCAAGCLATSGCAYADLYFVTLCKAVIQTVPHRTYVVVLDRAWPLHG